MPTNQRKPGLVAVVLLVAIAIMLVALLGPDNKAGAQLGGYPPPATPTFDLWSRPTLVPRIWLANVEAPDATQLP